MSTIDNPSRRDRIVLRLLRIIARLIGGRKAVKEYDQRLERTKQLSRAEFDAECRAELREWLDGTARKS